MRARVVVGASGGAFRIWARRAGCACAVLAGAALPALAQGSAPNPADTPVGIAFRWLNFLLVAGTLGYVLRKFGGPYFREHAKEISADIRGAMEARAAAERELAQATERLQTVDLEIQELRRASARETAAAAERIRELTRVEIERVGQAGAAEISAAERAARQELRAIAAQLTTERAAALVRARLNAAVDAALFDSFVSELAGSAR